MQILKKVLFIYILLKKVFAEPHFNLPDPECTGPFGTCTKEDKIRLGFNSIKKLHAKMDDDHDGQVELQETQEVEFFK